MRIARIQAVVGREIVRSATGRRGRGFALVALSLLLPAAVVRLPGAPRPDLPVVQGELPAALEGRVSLAERAPVELSVGPPVVVRGRAVGPELRSALAGVEPAPAVELRLPPRAPLALPRRTLLLALLAISLLTGPLAETLPGEREGGTMEVLLASSLSRGEIVVGKWLAWTGLASAAALLSAAGGLLSGALSPGSWIVALPAALSVAVALGLWLVRGAADLVGGAAAPMRVLPVVAVGAFGLSWAVSGSAPLLAAAVPLGGALLSASGLLPGVLPVALALGASLLAAGALLRATTGTLERQGVRPRGRGGSAWAGLAFAGVCWWLAVAGPATFLVGGADALPAPPGASLAAGGLLLALVAAVLMAREGHGPAWGRPGALPLAVAVGAFLAVGGPALAPVHAGRRLGPLLDQLSTGLDPLSLAPLAAVLVVVGQELFFREALQRRVGVVGAVLAWTVLVCPMDPILGLVSGLALGLLRARGGLLAALGAHATWSLAQPWTGGHGLLVGLGAGSAAVALAALSPVGARDR